MTAIVFCSFPHRREVDTVFTLSEQAIDTLALRREFHAHTAGALVVFEGIVRDFSEGRNVVHLAYEASAALAQAEYALIIREASGVYPLIWTRCVHRTGEARPGEVAIWLGVATAHRAEAFEACRWIIDQIKHRLPVWKKEYYADGESDWINGP
jgi:molybdopterin synthase catalytic subunit